MQLMDCNNHKKSDQYSPYNVLLKTFLTNCYYPTTKGSFTSQNPDESLLNLFEGIQLKYTKYNYLHNCDYLAVITCSYNCSHNCIALVFRCVLETRSILSVYRNKSILYKRVATKSSQFLCVCYKNKVDLVQNSSHFLEKN